MTVVVRAFQLVVSTAVVRVSERVDYLVVPWVGKKDGLDLN